MPELTPRSPNTAPRPVASIAEAEHIIGHLGDAIDSLVAILEEETPASTRPRPSSPGAMSPTPHR
jgi:hypothetical protein